MLMKHLPQLRGMTVYPDGARGGQPLSPVKYATAISHVGKVFLEQADVCDITKGGSCGA
jgi:ribonucleoside-diphosphate reductase alpha chain